MQAYSNPDRETDPFALPDLEIFEVGEHEPDPPCDDTYEPGWYYWYCFPGCMPDSVPYGPFASEAEALADAQEADLEIPDGE